MSPSSRYDVSCRCFVADPGHMEGAHFIPTTLGVFVMNAYFEKLVMHQLSWSYGFLSFTYFSGDLLYFFKYTNIPVYLQ